MNRIVFVGICLIGMALFGLANADKHVKPQPKEKLQNKVINVSHH